MNTLSTIITALGGTGAIAALIAALTTYLKTKSAAEDRRKDTAAAHKAMAEDMAALRKSLDAIEDTLLTINALREENETLRIKVTRLENQNERLTVALARDKQKN